MAHSIFLSTVTDEFGDLRLRCKEALSSSAFDYKVIEQSHFPQDTRRTVSMLCDLVKKSDVVIHLVGEDPGGSPDQTDLNQFLDSPTGKNLLQHAPNLRPMLGDLRRLSYTEWEAVLARHFEIPLLVYTSAGLKSSDQAPHNHLGFLREMGRYALANSFADYGDLIESIHRDLTWALGDFATNPRIRDSGDFAQTSIGGISLLWIPPGQFTMGLDHEQAIQQNPDHPEDAQFESPPFSVRLPHGFWMSQTPVTQHQYRTVMDGRLPDLLENPIPDRVHLRRDNLPAIYLSWDDAKHFCAKLSSLESLPAGYQFRLPGEAEWEYACRAGEHPHFSRETGIIDKRRGHKSPQPVGHTEGHPWKLQDMLGNVLEWCEDYFSAYPETSETISEYVAADPHPDFPGHRVLRGSSCQHPARWSRPTARSHALQNLPRQNGQGRGDRLVGFRIVLAS